MAVYGTGDLQNRPTERKRPSPHKPVKKNGQYQHKDQNHLQENNHPERDSGLNAQRAGFGLAQAIVCGNFRKKRQNELVWRKKLGKTGFVQYTL